VSLQAGTYRLGPDDGTLRVRTGRSGAAAKAGHDLLLEVAAWEATLTVGDEARVELSADAGSLRVLEGTGGIQSLGDDDKAEIQKTIAGDVLKGHPIAFRSTAVEEGGDALAVAGELTIAGATRPLAFDVDLGAGRVRATVVVTQSEFGMKPYSTLFGALKVADEVRVEIDAAVPQSR
jgi:polyisoprenoid-binding protein YceI